MDVQGCIQLKILQVVFEFNFGYLIYVVDNYCGSFCGMGVELCIDVYGVLCVGSGILFFSYWIEYVVVSCDLVGDNIGGMVLLKQVMLLGKIFNQVVVIYKIVVMVSYVGLVQVNVSVINDSVVFFEVICMVVVGMVDGVLDKSGEDVVVVNMQMGEGKVLQSILVLIGIVVKDGMGVVVG